MHHRCILFCATLFCLAICAGTVGSQETLSDSYEILHRHHTAIGGLDKLRAEKTSYFEGTIVIEGTGLEGTFRMWTQYPLKQRQETELKIIKQVMGDNGEFGWMVDQNGKLIIRKDENSVERREVRKRFERFEHLIRESDVFSVTFDGRAEVDGVPCYVIRTTNTINDDVRLEYINTTTFFVEKMIEKQPDMEQHIRFSDYREVDGIQRAFRHDITNLSMKQNITMQLTHFESNIEIDPSVFEPPQDDVADYRFTKGGSAENIPFRFIEDHVYIPVTIKGKERLWILDTGAGMTCIDSGFAVELGLELQGSIKGQGAGNQVDISFVELPPFRVANIEFDEQKAASLNLRDILYKAFGLHTVGILGFDFLSRFVTKIDYANELISFYDPQAFEYDGDGVTIDATLNGKFFTVPITVDGQYTGTWHFDLGAGGCSFHYPYAAANGFLDRAGVERVGRGAGGTFITKSVKFQEIEFAGYRISDPVISMPLEKGEGAFSKTELVGNLGNTLFRHFVIHLDYENQQMIVDKGTDFSRAFPHDNSGLQVQYNDHDQVEIAHVSPGTPAQDAGFQKQDILESVNGIQMDHLDGIIAVRELLRREPGTEYVFAVLRNGELLEMKLKLANLYATGSEELSR